MNIVQVGSVVEFVDSEGAFHFALVQKIFHSVDTENPMPMINLVYVDLNGFDDNLGKPEIHSTSIPHKSSGNDNFYWCHIGQDHD